MSNTQFARGLFPLKYDPNEVVYFKANTATDLYLYQPVCVESAGFVTRATCGSAGYLIGTIVGFADSNGGHLKRDKPYAQTTDGDGKFLVACTVDPDIIYLLEEDTGGTALTESAIGNLADFTYLATTGNTTTGIAQAVLDRSGVQTSSGQFILLGRQRAIDGENEYGDYCKWLVKINNYQWDIITNVVVGGV